MNIKYCAAFAAIDSPVLSLCRAVNYLGLFIKPRLLDCYNVSLAVVVKRQQGEAVSCRGVPIDYC
jgi:hypothetical protein